MSLNNLDGLTKGFIVVVLILGGCGFIYLHEQVHVEIFRHYGVDSRVEYFSHLFYAVTIPEEPCPNVHCTLAHNITDIVGYHLQVFYFVPAAIMLYLMFSRRKKYEF